MKTRWDQTTSRGSGDYLVADAKIRAQAECRCDCVNCVTSNHSDCYYKDEACGLIP